jgi:damage-control phosphatase, subfamily I
VITEKPVCRPSFSAAPLNPFPDCVDCLAGLAQSAVAMVSGNDPDLILRAKGLAEEIMETAYDRPTSSPEIANRILRRIRAMFGVEDPYASFKAQEMAHAREMISRIGPLEGLGLRPLVQLAALGNSLDFFTNPNEALAQVPEAFLRGITFYREDISELEDLLSASLGLVLYLTDNSGEVFFDLPLYEHIAARAGRTVMVVKGGPALNDLTRSELNSTGLGDRIKDIADTGTDGAGIDWENVSAGFLKLLSEADLVVSKGMANFETLYPRVIGRAVFYVFKSKCRPVQDYIQAPPDSYMALLRRDGRDHRT